MSKDRKKDHIEMAFNSVPLEQFLMDGFAYEPLMEAHPTDSGQLDREFLGMNFKMPVWVSSMTGGTEMASVINTNLAKACGEFGMGLGLGSCRPLLDDNNRFGDFDIKHLMPEAPLFTNFGIAQIEELVDANSLSEIDNITKSLKADGIIIHVNPLQEWNQPEGDRFKRAPLESIKAVLAQSSYQIIVKEVGQGFGPKSLKSLMDLPLAAIEFGAFGGTNFTLLEQARLLGDESGKRAHRNEFGHIGHSALEMVTFVNELRSDADKCQRFIISGGVKSPLDAHRLLQQLNANSVVGVASGFLKYAMKDYDYLREYVAEYKDCLLMANAFLKRV